MVAERIWLKIGMENDGIVGLSSAGESMNGGIVATTLCDFARFATALTPSWKSVAEAPLVDAIYFTQVLKAADLKDYKAGAQGQRMITNFGMESNPVGSS